MRKYLDCPIFLISFRGYFCSCISCLDQEAVLAFHRDDGRQGRADPALLFQAGDPLQYPLYRLCCGVGTVQIFRNVLLDFYQVLPGIVRDVQLIHPCAYLFCEGDVLEKNGSAGSVKFFSHFGLQTLACMKSTCNGPVPNDRLQALRVHRLFAAPLGAGRMAQTGTDQHMMSTTWPFCAGAFLQGLPS